MSLPAGTDDIGVVLIDDHFYLRAGVRRLLAGEPGITVLGEGASGQEALLLCEELRPDVLLMDIDMPGMSGVDAARALRKRDPASRIVMLTVSEDADHVTQAILAGASGYVVKGASARQIAFAVRSAAAGEVYLSPTVTADLLARWTPRGDSHADVPALTLSVRELAVLRLLAEGMENSSIAAELHISTHTVRRHVQSILEKLGLGNRTQAAVYAVRSRLI